jgi:hypothetical protein
MNKLKSMTNKPKNPMALFGVGQKRESKPSHSSFEPAVVPAPIEKPKDEPKEEPKIVSLVKEALEPKIDEILDDSEAKIKLSLAHDRAVELLTDSVAILINKLDDVKADKLPAVIMAASRTVESIRKERLESIKNQTNKEVHFHFYTPEQKSVEDYPVIEVQ